jgi:toxin ParE1/3/4
MKPLFRTTAAIGDLISAATYLGSKTSGLETRFLDAVEESLDRIAQKPEIGGVYENQNPRLAGMRVWRVAGFEKYLIFYQISDDRIEIVRILHGARDIAAILEGH